MKPHKHAEIIKAWADGARVERFIKRENRWVEDSLSPFWYQVSEYRIKHEPVVMKVFYKATCNVTMDRIITDFIGFSDNVDLEQWDLKLTFTDGKLTNAEVAK
jgi:hypothetical protein